MRQLGKRAALLAGAILMTGGIAYFAYVIYRDVTVQIALSEGRRFATARPTATPVQSLTGPLARLRPHPLSSPLHNRRFDEAIAGARAAYDAGDYDRAIALNTKALEIHPSEDLVWLLLTRRADSYLGKKEPDKALADYDAAARLGGLDSRNYITRALTLRQKGKREEAAKDFEAAIATSPDDALIYSVRADTFAEDGNLDLALADYAKALELNPRNIDSRLACAEIYLRQNENQKAIKQATIALQIDPNSSRAYVTRAKAYAQLRMNSQGLAELEAAASLKTGDKAGALNNVAWCRATGSQNALRDGKKAVAEATKACELDRWKHWSYIDTLAAADAEAGEFDQAIKYQKKALQMAPARSENIEKENLRLQLYEHHKPYREEMKP
jgi:tetratricopeptide (TPR) repeat protein